MKNINTYQQLFEAKQKTDWKKVYTDKLTEIKNAINKTFELKGININDVIEFLLLELNDVSKFNYSEYIKLEGKNDKISVDITSGNYDNPSKWFTIKTNYGLYDTPYQLYKKLTRFLDKNKNFSILYNIYFDYKGNRIDHKSPEYKELLEVINNVKNHLRNLGFSVEGQLYFKASIELDKLEGFNPKTLDLSDLFPKNIVDDFEQFIIKKNLSRKDAEEIASIIKKMDTQT